MNTHVRGRESHARRIFIEATPQLRRLLAAIAEAAIDALDQIEGDADEERDELEVNGDEDEPTLGRPEGLNQLASRAGRAPMDGELEAECEDEGAQCDDEGESCGDREPWLGWHNETGSHGGTWLSYAGLEG